MNNLASRFFCVLPARLRNYYYYHMGGSIAFPEVIHIESTNICNASCIICPREKLSRKTGIMDFGLFSKIIDECVPRKEVKELHLNGFGECLLDKKLIEKIRYAKEKGIRRAYFVTNASLLNDSIARGLVCSGLDSLKISIYGFGKDVYEKIHKGLDFEATTGNILNLIKVRKELKSSSPQIKIQFLPLSDNIEERQKFLDFWSSKIDKRCNDRVEEFCAHNWVDGRKYNNPVARDGRKSCGFPFFGIQILWDGSVALCCYDFNAKLRAGDIKKETISAIWNSSHYNSVRKIHREADFAKLPLCGQCDQLREGG
ncbi:hypothetical protein EPN16_08335 [bacterium]|nr:MAG: hypothetical protein EPN16_08335 [bacterium]